MKKTSMALGIAILLTACAPSPTAPNAYRNDSSASRGCHSAKQCEELGVRYITGDGVPIDGYKAVSYLKRACNMGSASACNGAAFIYADAEGGVKQDYRKALDYWNRACQLGDRTGCANYGLAQDKLRELRSSR